MAQPQFVVLVGTVDGVNTVFTTPGGQAYEPGTTITYQRSLPRVPANDDGHVETTPASGVVTLKEAPFVDDPQPMMAYMDTSTSPELEVSPITGVLTSVEVLESDLEAVNNLTGVLECP